MSNSSLPSISTTNKVFNRFYNQEFFYNPSDVDAAVGYFLKRGFDKIAAINTASILLQQASKDKLPIFELLDTLKGVTDVQLNNIIAQILNLSRSSCSTVGYRLSSNSILYDQRNVLI